MVTGKGDLPIISVSEIFFVVVVLLLAQSFNQGWAINSDLTAGF